MTSRVGFVSEGLGRRGQRAKLLLVGVLIVAGTALVLTAIAGVWLVEVTTTENVWGEDRPAGVVVETTCGRVLEPVLDCDANRDRANQATVVFGVGLVSCVLAWSAWALVWQRRPRAAVVGTVVLIPLAIGVAWLWRSAVVGYYERHLS